MKLTKKQIINTVNKMRLTAELKKVLVKQCLNNDQSARFVVYAYYKKLS